MKVGGWSTNTVHFWSTNTGLGVYILSNNTGPGVHYSWSTNAGPGTTVDVSAACVDLSRKCWSAKSVVLEDQNKGLGRPNFFEKNVLPLKKITV